jgi:hypothetical protein
MVATTATADTRTHRFCSSSSNRSVSAGSASCRHCDDRVASGTVGAEAIDEGLQLSHLSVADLSEFGALRVDVGFIGVAGSNVAEQRCKPSVAADEFV